MAIKKRINKSNTGFWHEAGKKTRESKDYFFDHMNDLFLSISQAKIATKCILGAVVLVGLLMMGFSMVHSYHSVSEKKQTLADMRQEISEQKIINEEMNDVPSGPELNDFVEQQARNRLDMIYPDEELYINTAG